MAYLWISKSSVETTQIITGIARQTVCNFFSHFRQLVACCPIIEENVIGGEGVIVELDESKIGKRKYNRGHHVEGVWILGGVERTANRRTFFVPIQERSANCLLPLISRHVLPGSIIYTDLWRGYLGIEEELGLRHFTVNHSESFVNPITGVHTNTIEGTWNGLKICIGPRSRVRDGMEMRLSEFQWRRCNENSLWDSFLNLLKDIHYD